MNFSTKTALSVGVFLACFSLARSAISPEDENENSATPSSRPLSLTFNPKELPLSSFLKATEDLGYTNPLYIAQFVEKMCKSTTSHLAPEELRRIKTVLQKMQENIRP